MGFTCRSDRHFIRPTYRSNRFVLVEIVAPERRREPTREPINIGFVLDRSGSMGGRKIGFARQAVIEAIGALDERDRFSVVAYDDRIDVVVESRLATDEGRRDARRLVEAIDARGRTDLFAGWMRGCEQVAAHQVAGDVNRVLLLSDGLANVGVTDPRELERHAAALHVRGLRTDTFGVGSDFDEKLLEAMAVAGGGHSYFIEQEVQIRDFITSAVGEALDVVARDVRLEVSVPDGVLVEPIGRFATTVDGDRRVVELGDLVSGQRLELVLRLNFPFGDIGRSMRATFRLRDAEGVLDHQELAIAWEYADHRTNDLQPRDRDVDRAVARRFAARVRQEALDLNRRGDFDAAALRLQAVAVRIRGYAGGDDELLRIAQELEGERGWFAAPMAASAVKQAHFRSSYEMRGRDIRGRAQRGS